MADSKISALPSASTPLGSSDVVPVVQSGTSKKATVGDIVRYYQQVKAVASDVTISSTTAVSITDLEISLPPGTYWVTGCICWQSTNVGNGIEFYVNCNGGTVSKVVFLWQYMGTSTSANGTADMLSSTNQVVEGRAGRANNTSVGPITGVDTINADILSPFTAFIVVTATTTFKLMAASEASVDVKVMTGTNLTYERVI